MRKGLSRHNRRSALPPGGASLNLNFVNDQGIDPLITFTRASSATYFDSAGVLQSAGNNVPRLDYNPATLAAQGLLIEEQRTNLLLQSADFATTWVTGFTTIAANTTASPDGGTNGDKLQETAVTNEHYVRQFLTGLTTNTTYTVSVFVKASERTRFRIRILDTDNVANGYAADYNLTTVAANGSGVGAGSITGTPSITSVGNGWFRCVVSGNASTGTKYLVDFFLLNSAGAVNYLGVAGEGLFLWGAQCELGAFPTSYIPTTTTALTRSADVASVNTLAPWYNATASTLYTEFNTPVPTSVTNSAVVAGYDDGTANNRFSNFYVSNTGAVSANQTTAGTPNYTITGASGLTLSNVQKQATRFQAGSYASSVNGAAVVTDSFASGPPTVNTLRIGLRPSGTQANMWLRRVAVYPRGLTNADLQTLTT